MYYRKIEKARKILSLDQKATLEEIRKAYRDLVKRNHPDSHFGEDKAAYERRIVQINRAYKLIMDYVSQFEISFKKDTVEQYDPERATKRFRDDWLVK